MGAGCAGVHDPGPGRGRLAWELQRLGRRKRDGNRDVRAGTRLIVTDQPVVSAAELGELPCPRLLGFLHQRFGSFGLTGLVEEFPVLLYAGQIGRARAVRAERALAWPY